MPAFLLGGGGGLSSFPLTTVADKAARLALTGLENGQSVLQEDWNLLYQVTNNTDLTNDANWQLVSTFPKIFNTEVSLFAAPVSLGVFGIQAYALDSQLRYLRADNGSWERDARPTSARTAVIPGATPNQPIHPHVSSPDGSVLELVKDSNGNWRAFYIPGDGSAKREIALGVAGDVDSSEMYDIEYTDVDNVIGLGASEKYSLISGNSDSLGANGLPIVQNFQQADAGANPYPLVISGGGKEPLGKKLNKLSYILRPKLGDNASDVTSHISTAQEGELVGDTLRKMALLVQNSAGSATGTVTAVASGTNGLTELSTASASLCSVGDLIGLSVSLGGDSLVVSLGANKLLVNRDYAAYSTPFDFVKKSRATVIGGGHIITTGATSKSIGLDDQQGYVRFNSASACIISLSRSTDVQYPVGFAIEAANLGSGTVSFNKESTVLVNDINGISSAKSLRAICIAPDEWDLIGS